MPYAYLRKIGQALGTIHVYPKVKSLIKEGDFKTFTFSDIQFAVDKAIEYVVKKETQGGIFNIASDFSKDFAKFVISDPILDPESWNEQVQNITKAQLKAQRENIKVTYKQKNINPLAPYAMLAGGVEYQKGSAGDLSEFDPQSPRNPAALPYAQSTLSDSLFGRDGRKLGGGANYNDTLKSMHSSEVFNLAKYDPTEDMLFQLETDLANFMRKVDHLEEVFLLLAQYICISYSEKKPGNKTGIGRWFNKLFNGRRFELNAQDKKAREDFVIALKVKEYNYYLKGYDARFHNLQITKHLYRYNLGQDKGVLGKKDRYFVTDEDFKDNSQQAKKQAELNGALAKQEEEQLLAYIRNPQKIKDEIAAHEQTIAGFKDNPYEFGVCDALNIYDDLLASHNTPQLEQEIQKQILDKITQYGEECIYRFLLVCVQYWQHNENVDCYFWDFTYCEFHGTSNLYDYLKTHYLPRSEVHAQGWKKVPFYKPDFAPFVEAGRWLLNKFKNENPNYQELCPSLEAFLALKDAKVGSYDEVSEESFNDKINKIKELNTLYFAKSQIDDLNLLYEYVSDSEVIARYKEIYGEDLQGPDRSI